MKKMEILRTNFNKAVLVVVEQMELEADLRNGSQERLEMLEEAYENLLTLVCADFAGVEHKVDQYIVDTAECILNSEEVGINLDWGFGRLLELKERHLSCMV